MEPLGALPATATPLTRFVSRDLVEPNADDHAEIGRLINQSKSNANGAFLSIFLPRKSDPAADAVRSKRIKAWKKDETLSDA